MRHRALPRLYHLVRGKPTDRLNCARKTASGSRVQNSRVSVGNLELRLDSRAMSSSEISVEIRAREL